MSDSKKPVILILPKWWPDEKRFHRGLFIQKHALAVLPHFQVACIYVHHDDRAFSATSENGILTIRAGIGRCSGFRKFLRARAAYKKGLKVVREAVGEPKLIHAQVLLSPALFGWRMSRRLRVPFIISEHWSGYITEEFDRLSPIQKGGMRKVVRKASCVITPSQALANGMQNRGLRARYEVVPNVVDGVDGYTPQPRNDNKIRLMNLSDMWDHKKNVSGLIRAVASVSEEDPRLQLYIVGDGRDKDKLIDLSKELGVLDKVVFFLGELSNADVLEFMKTIDFYVMNSRVETFGIAIVESIACGKPVIATDCGGPGEFVTQEVGLLIPPDDDRALKEAIRQMSSSFEQYDQLKLMRYAAERFHPDVVGQFLATVYRSVIG